MITYPCLGSERRPTPQHASTWHRCLAAGADDEILVLETVVGPKAGSPYPKLEDSWGMGRREQLSAAPHESPHEKASGMLQATLQ
jgi:hypothetical protein